MAKLKFRLPPSVQPAGDGDGLQERRLAGPVLAGQERDARVERQRLARPADGRQVEREPAGVRDAVRDEFEVRQVRPRLAPVSSRHGCALAACRPQVRWPTRHRPLSDDEPAFSGRAGAGPPLEHEDRDARPVRFRDWLGTLQRSPEKAQDHFVVDHPPGNQPFVSPRDEGLTE